MGEGAAHAQPPMLERIANTLRGPPFESFLLPDDDDDEPERASRLLVIA